MGNDKRFSRRVHEDSLETIDAYLYTGCPDTNEIDAIEEYLDRWNTKISEWRRFHRENDLEKITWTKRAPDEEGFYWYRRDNDTEAFIVFVFYYAERNMYRFMIDKSMFPGVSVDVVGKEAMWAGPIKKP